MRETLLVAVACLSVAAAFSPGPSGLFTAPGLRSGGAEKREVRCYWLLICDSIFECL